MIFPVANHVMHMFNRSLMNLQSIRFINKFLESNWFRHACIIAAAPSHSIQNPVVKLYQKWLREKKLLFWRKLFFFRILVPANVQYVCNEPAKRHISSTNTVRWVDFTVHALLSRQSNFSRRTKGINRKGMSPYTFIFLYSNTSSVSRFMQKYEKNSFNFSSR